MRTLRFLFNLLVCAQSLNHVWLFVTLWTVARQAPLSMGFFRQEYQSGLSFPPPRDLLNPGIKALINLIEQFTELRETFYLVDHWFITKEYNSGTTKWVIGQHRGKRHVPLCSLCVYHLPPNLYTFTSLEALGTSYYWDFYGGFIMKAQSIINSVFRPSLFSRTW